MTKLHSKVTPVFGVGIIGCGLIGQKRARAIAHLPSQFKLIAAFDQDLTRCKSLANAHQATAHGSAHELLQRDDIQVVIISTPHDSLAVLSSLAIQAGKHVLVEKPAARTAQELSTLVDAVSKTKNHL